MLTESGEYSMRGGVEKPITPTRPDALACERRNATSPAVDESSPAVLFLPSTTGYRPVASSLPSSTPHWSKALMFQMAASTKTRCS